MEESESETEFLFLFHTSFPVTEGHRFHRAGAAGYLRFADQYGSARFFRYAANR